MKMESLYDSQGPITWDVSLTTGTIGDRGAATAAISPPRPPPLYPLLPPAAAAASGAAAHARGVCCRGDGMEPPAPGPTPA
ncbi:hypothetical protein GPECTOR_12g449 [Gonium pectorale]|uniref:Uncharacterized protein n=1 Tax=Gonium pectorale TaxID=33097 RepID=A0A150GNQ0_GONPE|nr:hypothetical protein GPECTOR_12g449 [Gonium pectorale]|eukprot:KXZ51486.1 hypothetical protein GPECTOR_12g449 [Gonium pectorale]